MPMRNGDHGKTGSRTELILLSLVFTLPFLGAWLVYDFIQSDRNSAERLYGVLLEQPPAISDINLSDIGSETENVRTLHGKWNLVYYLSGDCGPGCLGDLEMLRNLRLSAAGNADKIQIVLLMAKPDAESVPAELASELNGSNISVVAGEDARNIALSALDATAAGQDMEDDVYIINPEGALILHYGNNREGDKILNDLKHLFQNPDYGQQQELL